MSLPPACRMVSTEERDLGEVIAICQHILNPSVRHSYYMSKYTHGLSNHAASSCIHTYIMHKELACHSHLHIG